MQAKSYNHRGVLIAHLMLCLGALLLLVSLLIGVQNSSNTDQQQITVTKAQFQDSETTDAMAAQETPDAEAETETNRVIRPFRASPTALSPAVPTSPPASNPMHGAHSSGDFRTAALLGIVAVILEAVGYMTLVGVDWLKTRDTQRPRPSPPAPINLPPDSRDEIEAVNRWISEGNPNCVDD